MKISKEPFTEKFWEELAPLVTIHKHESSVFPDKEPDPNIEMLLTLEELGYLLLLTIRDDGKLVGYVIYEVSNHIQFKTIKCANHMSMFILPDYRGSEIFFNMISAADEALEELEVEHVFMHSTEMNNIGRLYTGLGFELCQTLYMKKIGE